MVSSGIASANAIAIGTNAKTSAREKVSSKQDFDSYLKSETLESAGNQSEYQDEGNRQVLRAGNPKDTSKECEKTDNYSNGKTAIQAEPENSGLKAGTDVETDPAEDTIQAANVLFVNILQIIGRYMEKTPDEISTMMEELGIDNVDLLSSDSINNLVTALTGRQDVMELLTDTELSPMIKNIVSEINELKSQFMDSFDMNQERVRLLLEEPVSNQEISELESSSELTDSVVMREKDSTLDAEMNREIKTTNSDIEIENPETQIVNPEHSDEKTGGNMNPETYETGENSWKNGHTPIAGTENDGTTNQNAENLLSDEKSDQGNQNKTTGDFYGKETNVMADVLDSIRNYVTESLPEESSRETVAGRIMNQIMDNIRLNAKPDMTSLEMQLEPESLGKVSISIVSKAGHITAEIAANNQIAKEAIEGQLNNLKDNLNQQGIKVEAIEVTIASHSFEDNLEKGNDSTEKQKENKNKRTISAKELAEINGEITETQDDMETKVMEQIGATVSYLA